MVTTSFSNGVRRSWRNEGARNRFGAGMHPKHTPPPDHVSLRTTTTATQAERERVMAIIADMSHKAVRGEYDHLDRRGLMVVAFLRVKYEQ